MVVLCCCVEGGCEIYPSSLLLIPYKAMEDHQSYYLLWLVFSSISCFMSCLLIANIVLTPRLWGLFFQQLSLGLAVLDVFRYKHLQYGDVCSLSIVYLDSTSSFFIGNKYGASYSECSWQEYQLQCASLCKAFFTVVICGISMKILKYMKSPTGKELLISIAVVLVVPMACMGVLIYFEASKIYCFEGNDIFDSHHKRPSVRAYLLAFLVPIYLCVILDFFFYCQSYRMVLNRAHLHGSTDEPALLLIVGKLKVYPLIFAVSWLPRALAITLDLLTGHVFYALWPISVVCIASSGVAVAVQYFRHQQIFPDVSGLYSLSSASLSNVSRNLPSWLSSSASTSVDCYMESQGEVDMRETKSQINPIAKYRHTDTSRSNGINRLPDPATSQSVRSSTATSYSRGTAGSRLTSGSLASSVERALATFNELQASHLRPSDASTDWWG